MNIIHIQHLDTTDSTNSEAMKHARSGAAEGFCVLARHQTAGRGRQGRTWVSDLDSGLYFSIVLRPKMDTRFLPLITLMAGVAVYETLVGLGLKPDIKWVNDLLVNEKKIAGILAEAVETPAGLAVILGIGINLTSKNFPTDIADTATSIEEVTGRHIAADDVARALTHHVAYFYSILQQSGGTEILEHWRRRSSYFSGKVVRVALEGGFIEGITDCLEENGALRVRTPDGSLRIVQAGDVQRVRSAENVGSQ